VRGYITVVTAVTLTCVTPCMSQTSPEPTVRELYAIINERDQRYSQRFDSQERAVAAALAAAKEAVLKAEAASEKRFESVNEFRSTLKDQQTTLLTRNEAGLRFKGIEDRITTIEQSRIQAIGRSEGATWLWGLMVAGVAAVAGLLVGAGALFGIMRAKPKARGP